MGNYITKADIIEQLPELFLTQLTDDEGLGITNETRVNAAIDDAEGEADGYLSARYVTPLSPVPNAVQKFTADIAIYNLFSRKDQVPPDREKRYESAVKFFANASKGIVNLGAAKPEPSNSPGGVEISGNTRRLTRDKMEGF